jgi:REP element-mobilizing transposase RayT
MTHSTTSLYAHIVYSTKRRNPWISREIRPRMDAYIGGVIRKRGGICLIANGMEDHEHILARLRQRPAVEDVIRDIKALSSAWIHKAVPSLPHFAWQNGSGIFAVSFRDVPSVTEYIANQEKHHRHKSFEEEYRELLELHGIEYDDDDDIWD